MRAWNRLLEYRAPARALGFARIGVSLAILLELPSSAATLHRLAQPPVLEAPYLTWLPRVTDPIAWALIGLWLLGGLGMLVGWRTRLAASVLTATLVSVLLLDQQLYSNHLYTMTLLAGLLTLADSGAALSLDARMRGERSVLAWQVWLLKAQVSIVYGFAALAKLNLDFLAGSVIASYLRRSGPLAVPDDVRFVEPMMVLAILAICLEAFLAIALWVPRWRPAAMVGALALHVGISGWLEPTYALTVYSLLMLPVLALFLDVRPGRNVVVWDDACTFCAGWVRWFRRLDWLHALEFVPRSRLAAASLPVTPEEAEQALQLVRGERVHAGFAAVTRIAEVFPVGYLWAPILRLPPIAAVGDRAYRRVAARRTCAIVTQSSALSEPASSQ